MYSVFAKILTADIRC